MNQGFMSLRAGGLIEFQVSLSWTRRFVIFNLVDRVQVSCDLLEQRCLIPIISKSCISSRSLGQFHISLWIVTPNARYDPWWCRVISDKGTIQSGNSPQRAYLTISKRMLLGFERWKRKVTWSQYTEQRGEEIWKVSETIHLNFELLHRLPQLQVLSMINNQPYTLFMI